METKHLLKVAAIIIMIFLRNNAAAQNVSIKKSNEDTIKFSSSRLFIEINGKKHYMAVIEGRQILPAERNYENLVSLAKSRGYQIPSPENALAIQTALVENIKDEEMKGRDVSDLFIMSEPIKDAEKKSYILERGLIYGRAYLNFKDEIKTSGCFVFLLP